MKRLIISILLIVPLLTNGQSSKVLIVVSSYGKSQGEVRPGYEFDEFAQAYLIFSQNGLKIDVASPKGGQVEPDKFNPEKEYNKIVIEDTSIMTRLTNTIPTASINPLDYNAIYIIGGKGAMFDLPYDPSLQDLLLSFYQKEKAIISSVCHGSAAFINVKEGDNFIVEDHQITGFCNLEEELFGKKWVQEFPFKLEDKLKSRGANFTQADFMLSHVAVSDQFITGQNPYSTTKSALAVVKALGIKPAERSLYKDERTIYLIQDILAGSKKRSDAEKELKRNEKAFDIELMALYGYYKMLSNQEDQIKLANGVSIVELTMPYFFNENLQFTLANNHFKLGNTKRANELLAELISKNLLVEEIKALRKKMDD